jgi:ATP-dependent DNA helicase RecQ
MKPMAPPPADDEIFGALRRHFHHDRFRDGQIEVIRDVLAGRDAVVVMPTGSGKSLCYQLSALLLPGSTLVVSPLISLMKDQVDALVRQGIPATFVNSSLSAGETAGRLDDIAAGRVKLVYVAPERFRNRHFLDAIRHAGVSLLAIDEAHCICQWGYDFRPDYLNLRSAVSLFPGVRVMAVTATATPEVRRDIVASLGLGANGRDAPAVHVHGFARPGLRLGVVRCPTHEAKFRRVEKLVEDCGSGIVYVATRKQAERVYERLGFFAAGKKRHAAKDGATAPEVILYHGALPEGERTAAQDRFVKAACPVVVATNAFGMGIDRADLRFVAHWDLPGSIEAYYQEIGRAGRDGLTSCCELLYNYVDIRTQQFFIDAANPSQADVRSLLAVLRIDCARGPATRSGDDWAQAAHLKNGILARTILGILERAGLVRISRAPGARENTVELVPGADPAVLDRQLALLGKKRALDQARLDAMARYADCRSCRHAYILEYFGEQPRRGSCSACDRCLGRSSDGMPPLTPAQRVVVAKVLSCVARMKGRFGARRIGQVLTGDSDPALEEKGLTRLSTFGILPELRPADISRLLDELADAGCVAVGDDEYRQVSITPKGMGVARNRPQFAGFAMPWPLASLPDPAPSAPFPKRRLPAAASPSPSGAAPGPDDGAARDPNAVKRRIAALKAWRKAAAAGHGVAPFVVLSNKSLEAIARADPSTRAELLRIYGIGPVRADAYGQGILDTLAGLRE